MAGKLRSDAVRNRARLLAAAQQVFDEQGLEAPTAAVAARAGVGAGTLFRHFRAKDDLVAAVLGGYLDEVAEQAEGLATADDPGKAFFDLLRHLVSGSERKNRYVAALRASGTGTSGIPAPTRRRLRAALDVLLTRAQESGAVRTDVDVAIVIGVVRAAASIPSSRRSEQRVPMLVLDALRA